MTTRRNATEDDNSDDLTGAQLTAIEAMIEGCSVTDAAARANVSRQTVSGWANKNLVFRLALASRRREQAEAHSRQLSRLHGKLLTELEDAADQHRLTVGEQVAIIRALNSVFVATDNADRAAPGVVKAEAESAFFPGTDDLLRSAYGDVFDGIS